MDIMPIKPNYSDDSSMSERTYKCDYCGKYYVIPNDIYQIYTVNPSLKDKYNFCSEECKKNYFIANSQRKEGRIQTANDNNDIVDDIDKIEDDVGINVEVDYSVDDVNYVTAIEINLRRILDCSTGDIKRGVVELNSLSLDNYCDTYISSIPARVIVSVLNKINLFEEFKRLYESENKRRNIITSKMSRSDNNIIKYIALVGEREKASITRTQSMNFRSFRCNMKYIYPLLKDAVFDDDRSINIYSINKL